MYHRIKVEAQLGDVITVKGDYEGFIYKYEQSGSCWHYANDEEVIKINGDKPNLKLTSIHGSGDFTTMVFTHVPLPVHPMKKWVRALLTRLGWR